MTWTGLSLKTKNPQNKQICIQSPCEYPKWVHREGRQAEHRNEALMVSSFLRFQSYQGLQKAALDMNHSKAAQAWPCARDIATRRA